MSEEKNGPPPGVPQPVFGITRQQLAGIVAGNRAALGLPPQRDLQAGADNPEVAYENWIADRDPRDSGSEAGFTAGWHAAAAVAGGWPRCPNGCGCRLGTADADAHDCGCDGLCCYDEIEIDALFRERDRLRELLFATRAHLGWIWRESADASARERADQALTALKEAGVE